MSQQRHQKWNYFVLNINIAATPTPPSPEKASKKLKGTLSPSFIQDQFPQEYKSVNQSVPMEIQLQKKLKELGSQGWELINISTVGPKLLFFFKSLMTLMLMKLNFSGLAFSVSGPCSILFRGPSGGALFD